MVLMTALPLLALICVSSDFSAYNQLASRAWNAFGWRRARFLDQITVTALFVAGFSRADLFTILQVAAGFGFIVWDRGLSWARLRLWVRLRVRLSIRLRLGLRLGLRLRLWLGIGLLLGVRLGLAVLGSSGPWDVLFEFTAQNLLAVFAFHALGIGWAFAIDPYSSPVAHAVGGLRFAVSLAWLEAAFL